ncbi:type IV secretion system protein VirB9 [Candidatus Xenohaliotis californiensis]|uniref:Type IV secretion system protein VirB9 n=1 Tax=Candidatus Xenohaliotis californiensis TaxID=84677 RepID=A0ABP0EV53_9RICK|nr:type IV secretion system protein VirB9 [Candidatus Xenohaliotis californiensis]
MNLNNKLLSMAFLLLFAGLAFADRPIAVDSRIKVFVYNEYEVFRLTLHYDHHAHIDFGKGEIVRSVSLGNSSDWHIEPVGSRLFIQPYEKDIYTNMTVITNKRTYEFDLIAKDPDDLDGLMDKDLIYVVKFFYPPDDNYNNLSYSSKKVFNTNVETHNKLPTMITQPHNKVDSKAASTINNKYSFIGDKSIAPLEIFDDGSMTYVRFVQVQYPPVIYEINEHNASNLLQTSIYKNYFVLNGVFHKLRLEKKNKVVEIFNDN